MIFELLEYCLTPCSWMARSMGFLRSSIEVRSRYARCREQWSPHLARTKEVILEAAQQAKSRRRALIFGAGLVHDIPLAELSSVFGEVFLADIVHTWPCRLAAAQYSNVKLVTLDVTGIMARLGNVLSDASMPLPLSKPDYGLSDSTLDFTVSVNLLSQLSWVPGHFLSGIRSELEVQKMKEQLVRAHLDYLGKLPGHTALITDVSWYSTAAVGTQKAGHDQGEYGEWDVLGGVLLPPAEDRWEWCIAPAPERSKYLDYVARVQAYKNWKRSALISP